MSRCYKWSKVVSLAVFLMAASQAQAAARASTHDDISKIGNKRSDDRWGS